MVNIYKTNVELPALAGRLVGILSRQFPELGFNFDLEDVDRILRVEGQKIDSCALIKILNEQGFDCEELLDEADWLALANCG